jgi:hypothetical protein
MIIMDLQCEYDRLGVLHAIHHLSVAAWRVCSAMRLCVSGRVACELAEERKELPCGATRQAELFTAACGRGDLGLRGHL